MQPTFHISIFSPRSDYVDHLIVLVMKEYSFLYHFPPALKVYFTWYHILTPEIYFIWYYFPTPNVYFIWYRFSASNIYFINMDISYSNIYKNNLDNKKKVRGKPLHGASVMRAPERMGSTLDVSPINPKW
jgi:hypothetical protein